MKRGFGDTTTGHLFGSYKYQGSPYDNPRDLESKERLEHKAKIPAAFKGHSANI